jgi:hypothetical protein
MAGETLETHLDHIRAGDLTGGLPVDTDRLAGLQEAIAVRAGAYDGQLRHGGWVYLGEVVALATQLITDLSAPSDQLEIFPSVEFREE